jgi:hypothetical protein
LSIAGGLGKPFDVVRALKAAGITPSLQRRTRLLNSLTKVEFETLFEAARAHKRIEATDRPIEREAREIIRARK